MGETIAAIRIRGPKKTAEVHAVVDTGATNTVISEILAKELGIETADADEVILANGAVEKVGIASAEVEILGIRRTVPLYIYRDNLIGLTTLEAAGLRVNPVSQELEKVPGKLLSLHSAKPIASIST
jgi:clan AA aspartic protease